MITAPANTGVIASGVCSSVLISKPQSRCFIAEEGPTKLMVEMS